MSGVNTACSFHAGKFVSRRTRQPFAVSRQKKSWA